MSKARASNCTVNLVVHLLQHNFGRSVILLFRLYCIRCCTLAVQQDSFCKYISAGTAAGPVGLRRSSRQAGSIVFGVPSDSDSLDEVNQSTNS